MARVQRKKCDSCGKSVEVESIFCGHCGHWLDTTNVKVYDSSTILRTLGSSSTTFIRPHVTTPELRNTTPSLDENIDQQVQQEEVPEQDDDDHWINLRWFIFILAALAIILLFIGILVQTQLITVCIITLTLLSIVLASIQAIYFRQWYWFACMLLFGPLTCIIYSIVNPITKQNIFYPPRQLILLELLSGLILFVVGIIMVSQSSPPWYYQIFWIVGVDMVGAGYVLTIIRNIIKKEWDWLQASIFFFVIGAFAYALFYKEGKKTRQVHKIK